MRYITAIAILSLLAATARGQAPVFSQFYASGLHLNPALAGLGDDVLFTTNYRSQWSGVGLPYRTFQFSATHPLLRRGIHVKNLGGIGATVFSDEAGPNREVTAQGMSIASAYNFHLRRDGKHVISTALQFGVLQRRIDFGQLQWSSQYSTMLGYDPSLPGEHFATDRVTTPVIHAGVMWRLVDDKAFGPTRMYYSGLSVANLNRPRGFTATEKDAMAPLIKWHGGYLHTFDNGWVVSPNYLIQHQGVTQINLGAYGAYALPGVSSKHVETLKMSAGLWYRFNDSVIITTGVNTNTWGFGFSFDANRSSLSRTFPGASAVEISLSYRIKLIRDARPRFSTPLI